jgi:hypothetical protein
MPASQADPHDAMMLTRRPTTVVTQATNVHDTMPDPYGASADEESLFSGIGADAPPTVIETKVSAQAPGGALAATAAAAVLAGGDAEGAATVRSGPGAAQAVYDALAKKSPNDRSAWAASRPQTASALSDYAKAVGLPAPFPASGLLFGMGLGTIALIGLGAWFLLRRRA